MASLHETFGTEGMIHTPVASLDTLGKSVDSIEFPQKISLLHQLTPMIDNNQAEVETTSENFIIRIKLDALFVPDTLLLRPEIQPRLRDIAHLLAGMENLVHVVGYEEVSALPEVTQPRGSSSLSLAYSLLSRRESRPTSQPADTPSTTARHPLAKTESQRNPSLAYASVIVTFFAAAGGVEMWRLQSKGLSINQAQDQKAHQANGARLTNSRRIEILITREMLPAVALPK